MAKRIFFNIIILSVLSFTACSKIERDSAKLSKKDGIWEIESMTLIYTNAAGETITENYTNNGFFILYDTKWYRHSLDMWDRFYGEMKITQLKNQPSDIIKSFNWFVDGDEMKVYEGEGLENILRSYSISRNKNEMILESNGENLFFYSFLADHQQVHETFKLKRYDFK